MKKTTWIGMLLVPALAGALLSADHNALAAEEQEQTDVFTTNAVASFSTNQPAVHTVFENTLPEGVDPASPFAQLVRMVQAGVDQNVMLAYIKRSPRFFELDADNIIYLTDLGTPPEVIEAAIARDQELMEEGLSTYSQEATVAEESEEEQPPEVTVDQFYDTLSPYGTWVYLEGYGRCWRPTVVIYDTGWQPYCDNGRWVYTDHGWYWMSNYSWGWTTFHYGRWFHHARYGWCWWPDTVWAPSWVYWRYNDNYCGWAPLPPHTVYRSGIGLVYRGSVVSVGFDFNLGLSSFTFVATRNFCDPNPRRHRISHTNVVRIYDRTRGDCRYDLDARRHTIINHGVPAQQIRTATRQDIKPVSVRFSRNTIDSRRTPERLDRDRGRLVVGRSGAGQSTSGSNLRGAKARNTEQGSGTSLNRDDSRIVRGTRQNITPARGGNRSVQQGQRPQNPRPDRPARKSGSQKTVDDPGNTAPEATTRSSRGAESGKPGTRSQQSRVVNRAAQTPRVASQAGTRRTQAAPQQSWSKPATRASQPSNSRKVAAPARQRPNPVAQTATRRNDRPQPSKVAQSRSQQKSAPAATRSTKKQSTRSDEY